MSDIYMNTSIIMIWLGNVGEEPHLVFQHLARFWQYQYDVCSGRSRPTDLCGKSHLNPPRYRGATSAAVETPCQRPWFFRAWVIQEKVLSRESTICCGSGSATWEEFLRGSSAVLSAPLLNPSFLLAEFLNLL